MKTHLFLAFLFSMAGSLAARPEGGSVGVGIDVGTLTGVSTKFWTSPYQALQFDLGSSGPNGIVAQGSILWHRYEVFHSDRDDLEHNLPLYGGLGGLFHTTPAPYGSGSGLVGVKGVMGMSYLFDPEPFDVFIELSPTLYITPGSYFEFHAGLGARYYFGSGGKKEEVK